MGSYAEVKPLLFAIFFLVANAGFAYSCWRLVRLARLGGDHSGLLLNIGDRIKDLILYVFLQKRVVDRKFGWNHVIFFWGFMVITVGHLEFMIGGIFPSFTMDLLPKFIAYPIMIGADVLAFLVLFAVALSLFRRIVIRPWFIAYKSLDGFAVLSLIALVMITYFLSTAAGIRLSRPEFIHHADALPVSNWIAGNWMAGISEGTANAIYEI